MTVVVGDHLILIVFTPTDSYQAFVQLCTTSCVLFTFNPTSSADFSGHKIFSRPKSTNVQNDNRDLTICINTRLT